MLHPLLALLDTFHVRFVEEAVLRVRFWGENYSRFGHLGAVQRRVEAVELLYGGAQGLFPLDIRPVEPELAAVGDIDIGFEERV